ncbi:hypothetical protein B0H16DRAFT_1469561 [Mycena metata]|uniref:Uncharacterized protein n=1 Tax=Mycena metata TaxID=1033252 RepID=A0AAD7HXG9_9AGAR|nr:hypothetical protein B0H16DRAFT_1478336 [Mycena metata]KAJ7730591.1 hypothetical protein B0H16DRAFT_1469561 [Mycena metata]
MGHGERARPSCGPAVRRWRRRAADHDLRALSLCAGRLRLPPPATPPELSHAHRPTCEYTDDALIGRRRGASHPLRARADIPRLFRSVFTTWMSPLGTVSNQCARPTVGGRPAPGLLCIVYTAAHRARVPAGRVRRGTAANASRFGSAQRGPVRPALLALPIFMPSPSSALVLQPPGRREPKWRYHNLCDSDVFCRLGSNFKAFFVDVVGDDVDAI